jgi:hypothetical protein
MIIGIVGLAFFLGFNFKKRPCKPVIKWKIGPVTLKKKK